MWACGKCIFKAKWFVILKRLKNEKYIKCVSHINKHRSTTILHDSGRFRTIPDRSGVSDGTYPSELVPKFDGTVRTQFRFFCEF